MIRLEPRLHVHVQLQKVYKLLFAVTYAEISVKIAEILQKKTRNMCNIQSFMVCKFSVVVPFFKSHLISRLNEGHETKCIPLFKRA